MVGKESNFLMSSPVFIPPRKRHIAKKLIGTQNYVDHVAIQPRQKHSPASPALEDALMKTSLLLKNKQTLPKLSKDNLHVSLKNEGELDKHEPEENEVQSNYVTTSYPLCRVGSPVSTGGTYEASYIEAKLSKSQESLSTRSTKKRVNIQTELMPTRQLETPTDDKDYSAYEKLEPGENSILNLEDNSFDRYCSSKSAENYLTITGTIKRGRKKGQSVDLQINMSREELENINAVALAAEVTKPHNFCCVCTPTTGLHVLLLSIICLPVVILITSVYSFYIGTLTWYNMFTYFNQEKSFCCKLIMSPILVLAYPFAILLCTIGLSIYAAYAQLNVQLIAWLNEVADMEKGFYGWLCNLFKLPDCSPYEVVVLTEFRLPDDHVTVQLSTEELIL